MLKRRCYCPSPYQRKSHTGTKFFIFENVMCGKLGHVDAVHLKQDADGPAEPALRLLWVPLHENNQVIARDNLHCRNIKRNVALLLFPQNKGYICKKKRTCKLGRKRDDVQRAGRAWQRGKVGNVGRCTVRLISRRVCTASDDTSSTLSSIASDCTSHPNLYYYN